MTTIRTLLEGLIDYAGLFPPAGLSMRDAATRYDEYRRGPHSYALGRFIIPAERLDELTPLLADLRAGTPPWSLSVLVSSVAQAPLLDEWLERASGYASVDAIEARCPAPGEIANFAKAFGSREVYLEIPASSDLRPLLQEIAGAGARAKVRTGGITLEAFPQSVAVAAFLGACVDLGVKFKATAGLHHPLRCTRPLTYEENSVRGSMHGFVNLFLAATLLQNGGSLAEAGVMLDDDREGSFTCTDEAIFYGEHRFPSAAIASMRREAGQSFGSCSFVEPIDDLAHLGWLAR